MHLTCLRELRTCQVVVEVLGAAVHVGRNLLLTFDSLLLPLLLLEGGEQLLEMLAFTLLVISCWLSCFMNLVRVFTWAECVISRWVVAARIVLR